MRLIDADELLIKAKPRGISEDVWAECELYKLISEAPTADSLSEYSAWFGIGETLVDESKGYISPEDACEQIRKYLQQMGKPENWG